MNDDPTRTEAKDGAAQTDPAAQAALVDELKSLGQHFAAALRAAASTPEALEVRSDLREGLRSLRADIDDALARAPVETLRDRATLPSGSSVRGELAGAIRALNRVLDRLAASMERGTSDPGPE